MAESTDLTEAAHLLTQAATSLINSPVLTNGQSGKTSTSHASTSQTSSRLVVPLQSELDISNTNRPQQA